MLNDNYEQASPIPVFISQERLHDTNNKSPRPTVLKTVKRNNIIYQASNLPIVININPRSIYNKTEDFKLVLEQYEADIVCLSETWERENLSLEELLNLEDSFSVISNVKQRDFAGGKPAIIVNKAKFNVTKLCPDPVTVPVGVEAVWALVSHKNTNHTSRVKYIAVCSLYYRGPKSTTNKNYLTMLQRHFTI